MYVGLYQTISPLLDEILAKVFRSHKCDHRWRLYDVRAMWQARNALFKINIKEMPVLEFLNNLWGHGG